MHARGAFESSDSVNPIIHKYKPKKKTRHQSYSKNRNQTKQGIKKNQEQETRESIRQLAYNADIDFIGAGIGEECLGDPEDRVLRRRLHAPPPRRHGSRPEHGAPAEDPTASTGPNRHWVVIEQEGDGERIELRDESSRLL